MLAIRLASMRKFSASSLNDKWMQLRYKEWEGERGKGKTQLQNATDADLFLKKFYSPFSGTWWDKAYADSIFKALPDNTAKQIKPTNKIDNISKNSFLPFALNVLSSHALICL